jgi:hypothetical protein
MRVLEQVPFVETPALEHPLLVLTALEAEQRAEWVAELLVGPGLRHLPRDLIATQLLEWLDHPSFGQQPLGTGRTLRQQVVHAVLACGYPWALRLDGDDVHLANRQMRRVRWRRRLLALASALVVLGTALGAHAITSLETEAMRVTRKVEPVVLRLRAEGLFEEANLLVEVCQGSFAAGRGCPDLGLTSVDGTSTNPFALQRQLPALAAYQPRGAEVVEWLMRALTQRPMDVLDDAQTETSSCLRTEGAWNMVCQRQWELERRARAARRGE